jgi:hypothetical protein
MIISDNFIGLIQHNIIHEKPVQVEGATLRVYSLDVLLFLRPEAKIHSPAAANVSST